VVKVLHCDRPASTPVALSGHSSDVNQLQWHPHKPGLLFSCAKDRSLRLWNVTTECLVAMFGGMPGHADSVLSLCIHPTGALAATASIDTSVRLWALDVPEVTGPMAASATFAAAAATRPFPTAIMREPVFATQKVHSEYVDWVAWFGARSCLLTKCANAVTHKLVLWMPNPSAVGDEVHLIAELVVPKCSPWFVKGDISPDLTTIVLGGEEGQLYLYHPLDLLTAPDAGEHHALRHADSPLHLHKDAAVPLLAPAHTLVHPSCSNLVRHVRFTPDGNTMLAMLQDGQVVRWDRAPA